MRASRQPAAGGIEFVYEQVQLVLEVIAYVSENDSALQAGGAGVGIQVPCDPHPGSGERGSAHYIWYDTNGSADLGPGDDFAVVWNTCWIDDPEDDIDEVLDGQLELIEYIELTEAGPTVLGVEQVIFTQLSRTETEQDGAVVSVIDGSAVTVDSYATGGAAGGLQLFLTFVE